MSASSRSAKQARRCFTMAKRPPVVSFIPGRSHLEAPTCLPKVLTSGADESAGCRRMAAVVAPDLRPETQALPPGGDMQVA